MKKRDIILIGAVLILALGSWFLLNIIKQPGEQVQISLDGFGYQVLNLNEEQILDIPSQYGTNRIQIKDGQVKMLEADCPDKLCVKHKAISKTKESIVCLPHKLVVEVKGTGDSDLDIMVK